MEKKDELTVCPRCKMQSVIPIFYGFPAKEAYKKEKEGLLKLGGCILNVNNPNYHCTDCGYEWI